MSPEHGRLMWVGGSWRKGSQPLSIHIYGDLDRKFERENPEVVTAKKGNLEDFLSHTSRHESAPRRSIMTCQTLTQTWDSRSEARYLDFTIYELCSTGLTVLMAMTPLENFFQWVSDMKRNVRRHSQHASPNIKFTTSTPTLAKQVFSQ